MKKLLFVILFFSTSPLMAQWNVGLKGGVAALEAMPAEQIKERKAWEINSVQKNNAWIPASKFCEIVERKGLIFV